MDEIDIQYFVSETGAVLLKDWLNALDKKVRARIYARLARIRDGNFGDVKNLGQGLFELRMDFGPGYRLYFSREGATKIVLLIGGEKSSQARDIAFAKECMGER